MCSDSLFEMYSIFSSRKLISTCRFRRWKEAWKNWRIQCFVWLRKAGCGCVLFRINFHLLNYLCDDLERFCCIKFFDDAPYKHLNAVRKGAHRRASLKRATRMQERAPTLKPVVDVLRWKWEMKFELISASWRQAGYRDLNELAGIFEEMGCRLTWICCQAWI